MPYSIEEHKHRYAAWASSRASSVKGCRFSVRQGKMLVESAGLNSLLNKPDDLPSVDNIDEQHREWRHTIIQSAEAMGLILTHGVAAKLINMYFKTVFVCGGYAAHERVKVLHPPIDAVLLKSLNSNNIGNKQDLWKKALKAKWSKFTSDEYEEVIAGIKELIGTEPFWKIEQYWQGYQ